MAYISVDDLREWLAVGDHADDGLLADSVNAATRAVDAHCAQRFEPTGTVEARALHGPRDDTLWLPSGWTIATTVGLVVKTDDNDDGTYETTWTATTDYVCLAGAVGGDGWARPADRVFAVGGRSWPRLRRPSVQITATWGWATTPEPVRRASLIVAAELWKLKDAPLGVAGFGEFGVVRVRDNPVAARLLAPFVHPQAALQVA